MLYLLLFQGLNNAVALDFHYAEQMIYWTDVTTQGSMIRRMHMNGSNMEVSEELFLPNWKFEHHSQHINHSIYFFYWKLCECLSGKYIIL